MTTTTVPGYTHLATVRGHRDVPVRKEGHYWWCRYQVDLGIVWGSRDVRDVRPATAAEIDAALARTFGRKAGA